MKFSLKDASKFGWKGLTGFAYNSKDDFPNASAAYFEVTEKHGKVKTTKSDRIYVVIDGEGEFTINGKIIPVQKMDVVIVPKNTPYDYRATKGTLKLFLVHCPAFDPKAEIKLE
jgi:mannose-6-phosphate isomerase-like protein (cupin superfamily)